MTPSWNSVPDGATPVRAPLLFLSTGAVFPGGVSVLQFDTPDQRELLADGCDPGQLLIALGSPRHSLSTFPSSSAEPRVGVLARVIRRLSLPGASVELTLEGLRRVRVTGWEQELPYRIAEAEPVEEVAPTESETAACIASLLCLMEKLEDGGHRYPSGLQHIFRLNASDPGRFADLVASTLRLTLHQRFALMETADVAARLRTLQEFAGEPPARGARAEAAGGLQAHRSARGGDNNDRNNKRSLQAQAARRRPEETEELLERLSTARAPAHVAAEVRRDIEKLRYLGPGSQEHADLRTHIDWTLGLPWGARHDETFDLEHVQRVLDEEHFGQTKAKERILEYLAVLRLRRDAPSPILCLVGSPGTGKTSLARAVAKALGREFVRLSVAGVREEAEIRGRRRPHAAAQPGMILETLRNVGSGNPVFVVDDIDKLGHDGHSTDPTGALLDVVDPERNHAFIDHYLEVPYDLSRILFILTANMQELVPDALIDRLEVIEIPGYTDGEKQQIVRDYLLPRILELHGLQADDIRISPEAVLRLVREYALEPGLRQLQRQLESICRKCARRFARGEAGPWSLSAEDIEEFLGPPMHIPEVAERAPEVGVATGLAWTPAGGDLLLIETIRMPGGGRMVATGQLGEVMRESVQAAFSLVRTRAEFLGIPVEAFADVDLHVHFPAGAIPKDGPSAGITITLALGSLFSNRPVRNDVATTGEVSLRGKVLPVGGIREKVMAAHRTGIRIVILPKQNLKNLADVPDSVRAEMEFIGVEHMDEVFEHALLDPVENEEPVPVEVQMMARKPARRRPRRGVPAGRAARQAKSGSRRSKR